jgi:xylulokinase
MRQGTWSDEILEALRLRPGQLPETALPGAVLGGVSEAAAAATGLLAGTPVIAGGGDGQAAGLGVNALSGRRAYLNLGTAVVAGIYTREYRTGSAWRTMGSCSGEGFYLETSLRSGTFLLDWFVANCGGGAGGAESLRRLELEALAIAPGCGGLLAVPYWGAAMTPYWDQDARGCFVGLSGGHRTAHLYRALLEGIALEQAVVMEMIEREAGVRPEEYVVIGGGGASALWRQILADVLGAPVRRSQTAEASSLGAAMCAAAGAGWFPNPTAAAEAMSGETTDSAEPEAARAARYAGLLGIYRDIYPQLKETFRKLAAFRATQGE